LATGRPEKSTTAADAAAAIQSRPNEPCVVRQPVGGIFDNDGEIFDNTTTPGSGQTLCRLVVTHSVKLNSGGRNAFATRKWLSLLPFGEKSDSEGIATLLLALNVRSVCARRCGLIISIRTENSHAHCPLSQSSFFAFAIRVHVD
jgi:hypothetical protein